MTTKTTKAVMCQITFLLAVAATFLVGIHSPSGELVAENFVNEFETPEPSWKIFSKTPGTEVTIQERRRSVGKTGGSEFIRVKSTRENSHVWFEHDLPSATVLDELEVSLWIKSNREGFALGLKITLPEVQDPETRAPLTISIEGDRYQTPDQWQQLKCRTTDKLVMNQLRMLRFRHPNMINPKEKFVDRVVVDCQLPPGVTDLYCDNLAISSLVRFQTYEPKANRSAETKSPVIQPVVHTGLTGSRANPTVEFLLHRLYVDKKPMFPRIVSDNGERPNVFASAGMNVVWVKSYDNSNAMEALKNQGLMITAVPPYAQGVDGEPLDSEDANLLPFGANTSPVLFWMLGARMTSETRPRLSSWPNQVRTADRAFNKRPIAADVIDNERPTSRNVDMLGISRHIVHSSFSMTDYRRLDDPTA